MRAIVYRETGGPEVLTEVDRPMPVPGPGEVLVRVRVSGVNPTDWKNRSGATGAGVDGDQVPHQDGAGVIEAVGDGVSSRRVGERVWLWLAAWQRSEGTAQEYVALPADQAVPLPDHLPDEVAFDLGASLGVPALTAHRALTVAEEGPRRLGPGTLTGRTVLVAGGAGAVGHAAIELARWAGATVVTTVSSAEKAAHARAAGAHHVVDYTAGETVGDTVRAIREAAPGGVHLVVEVAPAVNGGLDVEVAANGATVAYYATNGGEEMTIPVRGSMSKNLRWQGLLLYTISPAALGEAVAGVAAAVGDGALRVGAEAGLPLHRFPLARTADAHRAVEGGTVGKVLVDVGG